MFAHICTCYWQREATDSENPHSICHACCTEEFLLNKCTQYHRCIVYETLFVSTTLNFLSNFFLFLSSLGFMAALLKIAVSLLTKTYFASFDGDNKKMHFEDNLYV